MKNKIKYAALNLSISTMLVMWLMSVGVFAEGRIHRAVPLAVGLGLTWLIHRAWQESVRMERLIRQQHRARQIARRARQMAVQSTPTKETLRVA